MGAKLFSQCYIGPSQREMCCCEALMLAFEPEDCGHLANQVSVWLESDLPTYHWFCGVPGNRISKYFDNLLRGVRRIIYDSSNEPPEFGVLDWPKPRRVRDLAQARLLPVRQSLGQFLSGFPIESLRKGLQGIKVCYASDRKGEAWRLCEWLAVCLGQDSTNKVKPSIETGGQLLDAKALQLSMTWGFDDGRYLNWELYREDARARFDFKLRDEAESFMTQLKPMAPEQALAEALFF
jgi:glucose-6-phosphate dehydrogenase assembly protein OpcA